MGRRWNGRSKDGPGYSGEISGRNKAQATGIWRNGDPGRKAKDFTAFSSSSSVL